MRRSLDKGERLRNRREARPTWRYEKKALGEGREVALTHDVGLSRRRAMRLKSEKGGTVGTSTVGFIYVYYFALNEPEDPFCICENQWLTVCSFSH